MLRLEGMGGVVAVRDMAGDARFLAELRRQVLVGETPGPRLFFSALMAGPAFFVDARTQLCTQGEVDGQVPWCMAVTKDTDLVQAVALAKGTYASGIKLYANLDADLTARIVAEAKRQGFKVWAHGALFPAKPSDVVRTGLASVSHAPMLVYEVVPMPEARREHRHKPDYSVAPDQPAIREVLRLMKEKDVTLDATLSVFRQEARTREGQEARAAGEYAFGVAVTELAYRAGVRISTGTDWNGHVRQGTPPLWDELDALQEDVGMSPADVLRAATVNGAKVLAWRPRTAPWPKASGHFAVLRENPLKDIKAVRSLRLTGHRRPDPGPHGLPARPGPAQDEGLEPCSRSRTPRSRPGSP